jgi:hypothetical protein
MLCFLDVYHLLSFCFYLWEAHTVLPLYGTPPLILELVYQYTTFKPSKFMPTDVTTSINSKVLDMKVDSFILSKTFKFRHFYARHLSTICHQLGNSVNKTWPQWFEHTNIIPPGVSVISHYNHFSKMWHFWHHRWACPPRCVLDRSVYQPTKWTVANVAHLSVTQLGGHAHLLCQKTQIFKTACNG